MAVGRRWEVDGPTYVYNAGSGADCNNKPICAVPIYPDIDTTQGAYMYIPQRWEIPTKSEFRFPFCNIFP